MHLVQTLRSASIAELNPANFAKQVALAAPNAMPSLPNNSAPYYVEFMGPHNTSEKYISVAICLKQSQNWN
jgi:hypothetical protein